VQHVNRFGFLERYSNPALRDVSVKTVLEDLEFGAVRLDAYGPSCGQSPLEILSLCAIARARQPRVVLEIGTFRGITTLLLALNTPDDAQIFTVDLPPGSAGTQYPVTEPHLVEKRGSRTDLWDAYGVTDRITQIYCDSATLSPRRLPPGIDLVFVDGSHSYDYVRNDSRIAFEVLSPDGVVIWDDYATAKEGVFRYLNQLAGERDLIHLAGTDLVMYDPGFHRFDDHELRADVEALEFVPPSRASA
jgi:predicted O-methyltransferase YrrM